ncbi:MAG: methyltransferase domain-containing protein [Pseudomonadota bacterium]|nr:methyltransferase domain-containing protein [Pseudomonadota bacterium]
MRHLLLGTALAALVATGACTATGTQGMSPASSQTALAAAVASPTRTPANVARDRYRHPVETLSFFGVRPTDTVVEISPGGGWYTEILAPYLAQSGTYYAVASERGLAGVRRMMEANPGTYGKTRLATFPASSATDTRVPDGSADVVLTFRNVHNWMESEGAAPIAPEAFRQIYAMLKPGGTLGVVDHRLAETADPARQRSSGYLKASTVRSLAEQAGFRFVGSSEVNANPRDTKDHPNGVWSLPPTLRGGAVDREKYLAIGESDRMTLKFVKPAR